MDDTNDPNIDESSERRENNVASENEHQIFSPNETGLTHQDETVIEKKQEEKPDQNVPQNHTSIELKVETETEIEIQFEESDETKPIELKVELETASNPIELEIEREETNEVGKVASLDLINENASILIDVEHCELKVVDDIDKDSLEEAQLMFDVKSALNELVDRTVADCLNEQMGSLRKRGEQLNDVKTSIKLLNDQIRDDLLIVLAELTAHLRLKIDDITDKIKGRLKDAYGVVRDAQTAIIERLNQVDNQLNYSQLNSESLDMLQAQLDSIGKELKHMSNRCHYTPPQTASMNQSALTPASVYTYSLFDDNYLYPNVDYHVDVDKIYSAIDNLSVSFFSGAMTNRSMMLMTPVDEDAEANHNRSTVMTMVSGETLEPGIVLDVIVSTGVSPDGFFWVQPARRSQNEFELLDNAHKMKRNHQRANLYIDEVCKYVRLKRIGDDSWRTYAELKRFPEINEKCYCLEPKSRRWMRAVVVNIDEVGKTCQMRLLDTGLADSTQYPLDSILPWRCDTDDLEVNEFLNYSPRAIRCVLARNSGGGEIEFERTIEQETRFLFRDLTVHTPIKCLLLKQVDLNNNVASSQQSEDLVWTVKLYRYQDYNQIIKILKKEGAEADIVRHLGGEDDKTLNEVIAKSNRSEHERMKCGSQIRCQDIRVTSGQVGATSLMIKTRRENEPTAAVETQSTPTLSIEMSNKSHQDGAEKNLGHEEESNQTTITSTITLSASQQGPSDDNNSDMQPATHLVDDPSSIQDVLDQRDENRLHVARHGKCLNVYALSYDGIFWIRPQLDQKTQSLVDSLSDQIGSFIKCTQFKSFGELGVVPSVFSKCFVRETYKPRGDSSERREKWHRGFIEQSASKTSFSVRSLDLGIKIDAGKHDIYPHRKIEFYQDQTLMPKINYQAIRCFIGKMPSNTALGNYEVSKEFREKFRTYCKGITIDFTLTEQAEVSRPEWPFKAKAWLVALKTSKINNLFAKMSSDFLKAGQERFFFVPSSEIKMSENKSTDNRNSDRNKSKNEPLHMSMLNAPLAKSGLNMASLPPRLVSEYHGEPLLPPPQFAMSTVHFPSSQMPSSSKQLKSVSFHEKIAALVSQAVNSNFNSSNASSWLSSRFDRNDIAPPQPQHNKRNELFSSSSLGERQNRDNHHWQQQQQQLEQKENHPPITANEFFSEPIWEGSQSIETNSQSQAEPIETQPQQNQVAPQTDGLVDVAKNFLEHELIQPSLPEKSSHNTYDGETKNKDVYTWRKGDQNRDRDRGRGFDRDRDRNSFSQHIQPQQQQQRSASTHVVHNRPSHREVCHRYQQHQHQLPNLMTQQTAAMPFTNAPIQAISHHPHPQQQRSPYSTAIPSYFQQRTNSGSTSVASSPGGAAASDSDKKRDERSDKKWRSGAKPGGCRPYNDGGDMDRSDGHGGGGNGGSGPRGPGGSGRSSGFYGGSSGASNEPGNRDNKRGTRRYDGGKRHGTIGLDDDIFGGGSTVRSTVTTTRVKTTTSYLEIYEGRVEEFDIGTATSAAAAAFEDDFEGEEGDEEEAGSSIYNDDVFIEDGDDEEEAEEDDDEPFYLERDLMLTANRRHRHSSLNEKTADMIAAASELRHNVLVVNENDDEVERKRSSEHQQLRSKESAASGSTSNQGLGYSISSPMANNLIVEGEDEANKTSINSFALIMDTSQPDNQQQQQQQNTRVAEESGTEGKGRRLWSPPSNVVKERGGRQRRHRRRNRPTTCVTSASSAELAGGKTRSFSADYALMRRDSAINLVSSTTSSSTSSSTTSTSSSSLSSISKLKKMNAELYKDKEDDLGCEDEEESYLSCTDELNNNNNTNRVANRTTNTNTNLLTENTTTTTNLSTKTTSDDQLIIDHKIDEFKYERRTNSSFDHLKVHTAAITNASSSLQSTTNRTEPNCYGYSTSLAANEKAARLRLERLEKMKKLTMAIFVESFEDNSSSSSSSDSSSASTIDGNSPNSLREFEANEARINRGSILVQDEEEDPFLFTSNPNNYANLVIDAEGNVTRGAAAIDVVSAKPPAPPGHQPNGGLQFNQRAPTSSSINNLLSPGGTDDTFETCYQSPTSNRHFAYDSDALDGRGRVDGGGDATDASMSSTRRKIEFFNRRANNEPDVKLISPPLRKRSSSSDAALPLPPPPPPQLMADIDALEPVAITDKLFEKFCIIENEEIMAVGGDGGDDDDNSESTLANNSKRSSNRAGAGNDLPDGATSKFVPNNANQFKIRSKILSDFLEAHANDQMSLTDPLSQQQNQNKIDEKQQQPIEEADQTANIQLSFSESQADSIDQIKKQLRYMSECGIGLGMYGPRPTTGRLQSTGGDANSTILNNRSTIDISSYTSDSLFNSNFIVTPLCSDAVSPSTAQNFAIKSPLLHPNLRSQSQSQNSPNSFSVKSPCFSIPPPAPPLPKFFTARAVPVSIAAINCQETGKQQLENCDEEKSISVSSSLPPPPPFHQVADLNPRIEDLSSEDTDKLNKGVIGGGEASETTVSTSTGAGVSSSSYSLPPPPPIQVNIPVAPPLPPNGLFATAPSLSTSTTHGSSRRSTSLNSTVQQPSETSSRAQVTHGPQSRIKALTAQLNLAECLSAGQPIAHRSRITESVVNNENKVNTTPNITSDQTSVSHIQKSSPYRYGNHMVANFANNAKPNVVATTTEKKPLKRTVASQTDIDNGKIKSGEKGKKPARKRPSVADKIRDGEQQAAANKRHEAANFNLYGLDTETDEQSLRAMGGKLPSPPPEFRSSVPPPQSVSSSTSLATTVVAANRIGANGLNMTHDKIKNWNSLQPIPSHIQTCNDDLEQVQSTIEELERRKNQETNTNKETNQEEESIRANRVQPFSSCPNLVQEPRSSPPAPPPGRLPPPPPLGEDENEELPTRAQTTFKLDHLANINPRRLYPNTKFRARIHDVIDERGRFHLEVMYARDDERKFAQIFKLFRLACKISPPPTDPSDLREGMRVGVFYKDDWHRAVVVEAAADSNHRASSHPRVKFLDLGIERRVDAQTNMRVVDEKFFNVPRKALRCSLYVDENVNEVVLASGHGIFRNEPLKLSSDARKFFVRVIYKKVLFAKVIEFTQDPQSNEPICKIRLGCQTHRGIIDVYLYLLSKFDRKRYELIKYIMPSPHQSTAMNRLGNNPVTPSSSTSTAATTTTAQSDSDSTAPTYTLPSPPHSIVHESFEAHVGGPAGEALNSLNSGGLQQQVDDEYDPDVLFSDLVGYFDRMKQAANGILNQVDESNQYDRNNNHQESEDCQSYEDDYEEDRRECRGGLDMTPVKEQRRRQDQNDEDDYDSDRTAEAAYNYDGSLYIESIHLPSITEPQQQLECAAQEEPAANISIRSAQQQPSHHHRYLRPHEVYKMSIPMPPSNPLSPPRLPRQRTHLPATNYNSDTDSSLMHATCCQMPFKAKKTKNTSSTKASPRTENHQRLFEEINNLANHGALNANNGKKVKFLS